MFGTVLRIVILVTSDNHSICVLNVEMKMYSTFYWVWYWSTNISNSSCRTDADRCNDSENLRRNSFDRKNCANGCTRNQASMNVVSVGSAYSVHGAWCTNPTNLTMYVLHFRKHLFSFSIISQRYNDTDSCNPSSGNTTWGIIYPTQSIPLLLMSWRHKKPRYQQYRHNSRNIPVLAQNGWSW